MMMMMTKTLCGGGGKLLYIYKFTLTCASHIAYRISYSMCRFIFQFGNPFHMRALHLPPTDPIIMHRFSMACWCCNMCAQIAFSCCAQFTINIFSIGLLIIMWCACVCVWMFVLVRFHTCSVRVWINKSQHAIWYSKRFIFRWREEKTRTHK